MVIYVMLGQQATTSFKKIMSTNQIVEENNYKRLTRKKA